MDIWSYILEKALVLIPVMIIIGQVLKNTPKFPDWAIPWALMACGIGASCMMLGFTVDAVIQGVLVAGAAVYGDQLYKQTFEKRADD